MLAPAEPDFLSVHSTVKRETIIEPQGATSRRKMPCVRCADERGHCKKLFMPMMHQSRETRRVDENTCNFLFIHNINVQCHGAGTALELITVLIFR